MTGCRWRPCAPRWTRTRRCWRRSIRPRTCSPPARAERDLPQALAAIDLALWDHASRRTGTPLARLIDPRAVGSVPVNATIGAEDRSGAASAASAAARDGFRCVKVKVGIGDDAGRLAAVRAAVGPEVGIRVDANGAWGSPDEALANLRVLEPVGLELCEEPVHGVDGAAGGPGGDVDPDRDGRDARAGRRRHAGGLPEDHARRDHGRAGRRARRSRFGRRRLPRLDLRRSARASPRPSTSPPRCASPAPAGSRPVAMAAHDGVIDVPMTVGLA